MTVPPPAGTRRQLCRPAMCRHGIRSPAPAMAWGFSLSTTAPCRPASPPARQSPASKRPGHRAPAARTASPSIFLHHLPHPAAQFLGRGLLDSPCALHAQLLHTLADLLPADADGRFRVAHVPVWQLLLRRPNRLHVVVCNTA